MKKQIMNTAQRNYGGMIILLIAISLLAIFVVWRLKLEQDEKNPPISKTSNITLENKQPQTTDSFIENNRFYSPQLNLSLTKLAGYRYEEHGLTIAVTNQDKKIYIGKIGTNTTNINDYLNSLEHLNKVKILSREDSTIRDIPIVKAIIKHPNSNTPDTISYFIYPQEWTIISIDTDNKEATQDLDTIAQSFQIYSPK